MDFFIGKFDLFWSKMKEVLDDNSVPHDRRHGLTLYRSPGSGSINQIRNHTVELLHKEGQVDFQIPSEEWTRLQFTPANIWSNTAIKYTLRFDIQWGLQTRLSRKHHPDHKYGTVLFIYFKEFAVKFRVYISLNFWMISVRFQLETMILQCQLQEGREKY